METDRVRRERRARGRFWGIRAKVFALVILSALLPTVLVGTSSYWTARNALTDKLSEQLNSKASLAAAQIFEWVQERSHDARVFASSGIVVANVERRSRRDGRGESPLREYLEHVLGRSGTYSSLLVLDDREALLSFAGSANEEDLVSLLESSSRSGSFFEFRPEGTTLWLQAPILGSEGRTVGRLLLGCRLDTLHDELAAASATDRLRLTSSDSQLILAHPLESVSAGALPEAVPEEGTIADYRDPRGVRVLAAARTVGGAHLEDPMLLVVATDWDVAFAAVTDLGRRIVLLSALAAVLVIALAYGLVVSLTGPLEKLTAGAHALSRGDYSLQIPVATGDEIGYLTQVFNQMTSALKKSHESLEELSVTDELTKLCNRRQFRKALAEELVLGEKTGIPFSIIMIDIDHFKSFNDRLGHIKGDELLERVGGYLLATLEDGAVAARYGGEEFVVILPKCGIEEAAARAEWLRTGFLAAHGDVEGVTLSMGVAAWPRDGRGAMELIDAADYALYQAKNNGRNQVVVAGAEDRSVGKARPRKRAPRAQVSSPSN